MSLVKCPECNKEISDTVENCIHCGYLISTTSEPIGQLKKHKSSETQMHTVIDALFALIYVYLIYYMFISDSAPTETSGAYWFGIFIGFVLIYFVQKLSKAILGTIARSFDSFFNSKSS